MSARHRWYAAAAVVLAGAGVGAFLLFGGYNVAATAQHTWPVHAILDFASQRSIALRARAITIPTVPTEVAYGRGLQLYREHCVQCHGAPGVAPSAFALGLAPAPANLAVKARQHRPAEVFWTVKYGLKMTAMPAWAYRLDDEDIWAVTAFVGELAVLSPERYDALANRLAVVDPATLLSAEAPTTPADVARGKEAVEQYACGTCHAIADVVGANHPVGPPLDGIASRKYLAGVLPNTRENMIRWLMKPSAVRPRTAMPDLPVSQRDARDMAAYLETLQ
jgi:mono/diheme cytochrome c family protein